MIESRFNSLDYGTKPSTVKQEVVKVNVNPKMVEKYAEAYVREAARCNPVAFEDVALSIEELFNYFKFLLKCRIECLQPEGCRLWRQLKACWIPDFFQFSLSMIGLYIDEAHGLKFVPVYEEEIESIDYLSISEKIRFFTNHGLSATKDAMPRNEMGDPDVMGFVIIDNFTYGRKDTANPITSYVAAFLGLKLVEETTFKMLYRVRYDDVDFICDMLTHDGSVIRC